jgi:hypothetical protein
MLRFIDESRTFNLAERAAHDSSKMVVLWRATSVKVFFQRLCLPSFCCRNGKNRAAE